jgi:hypothetical protein
VSNGQIIWRHILPNSMTPVVTFLPFRMSAAILALTSLDFLGLGVPPGTPSLGELLSQGKNNIDAWWISLSTFGVLVITLLLLTFMGDALRDALDPRKAGTPRHCRPPGGQAMSESTSMKPPAAVVRDLRVPLAARGGARRELRAARRRKAGAGGRIRLGQDGHGAGLLRLVGDAHQRPGLLDGRDLLTLPEREMQACAAAISP